MIAPRWTRRGIATSSVMLLAALVIYIGCGDANEGVQSPDGFGSPGVDGPASADATVANDDAQPKDDAAVPSVTPQDFCATFVPKAADYAARCAWLDAVNRPTVQALTQADCQSDLGLAARFRRIYDPALARKCLDALANAPCDARGDIKLLCGRVFSDLPAGADAGSPCNPNVGGPCSGSGLSCIPDGLACPTCRVRQTQPVGLGESCVSAPCDANGFCSLAAFPYTCVAWAPDGQPCGSNARCNPATSYCKRVGQASTCAPFPQENGSCSDCDYAGSGNVCCTSGQTCSQFRCVVPAKSGEACATKPCLEGICMPPPDGGVSVCARPRQGGEACLDNRECQSNLCLCQGPVCASRACAPLSAGGTCVANAGSTDCEAALYCRTDEPFDGGAKKGSCAPRLGLGAACPPQADARSGCEVGLACRGGTCQAETAGAAALGESCTSSVDCGAGLYCAQGHCAPRLRGDAGCSAPSCELGFECRYVSGAGQFCLPVQPVGQGTPCDYPSGSVQCREGLVCGYRPDGGICNPLSGPGGLCGAGAVCASGSSCLNGTCAPKLPRGTSCNSGNDCRSGRCVTTDAGSVCSDEC